MILTNEDHRSVLKGWLPSQEGKKWRLLFRASRDGFAAAAFHSKCDKKGPTVTIVKSGNNIFGGFTEQSWTSPGNVLVKSKLQHTPGQSLGYLNFWKIFVKILPSTGNAVLMSHHMSISGDQMTPSPSKLPGLLF